MRTANPFLLGFAQGLCAGVLVAIIAAALVLRVANLPSKCILDRSAIHDSERHW